MTFTAHNIRLDDGTFTRPEVDWHMAQQPVFIDARDAILRRYPSGFHGESLLDLGCLEGGYTVEFARMGLRATGLEVRASNLDNCRTVKAGVDLPYLRFEQGNCWDLSRHGKFDIIFCSGLLYHLAEPQRFLRLMARHCDLLILDTHFATEELPTSNFFNLSCVDVNEGLSGRWYTEYADGAETRDEQHKWSSWGNRRSFWPFKSEVIRAVEDAGFANIMLAGGHYHPDAQRTTIIAWHQGGSHGSNQQSDRRDQ